MVCICFLANHSELSWRIAFSVVLSLTESSKSTSFWKEQCTYTLCIFLGLHFMLRPLHFFADGVELLGWI